MTLDCTETSSEILNPIEVINFHTPARINLSSSEDIRREMAKVYREARGGKLLLSDATKFSYILTQMLKAYELSVLESRMEILEGSAGSEKD